MSTQQDIYWVTLDGDVTVRNGNPNSTENLFQQLMYSATDLGKEQHELVLQNKYSTSQPSWVDVDFMLVTSGDGDPTYVSLLSSLRSIGITPQGSCSMVWGPLRC